MKSTNAYAVLKIAGVVKLPSDVYPNLAGYLRRLVEMDKRLEEVKHIREDYQAAMDDVVATLKVLNIPPEGFSFQDEVDGVVHQITIAFVYFQTPPEWGLVRTRRDDEKKGSLSSIKAKEMGYEIPEREEPKREGGEPEEAVAP